MTSPTLRSKGKTHTYMPTPALPDLFHAAIAGALQLTRED